MKLKPGATLNDVKKVCNELQGTANKKRFAGACLTRMDLVSGNARV